MNVVVNYLFDLPGFLPLPVLLLGLLGHLGVEGGADAVHPTAEDLLVGGGALPGRVHGLEAVELLLDLDGHHDGCHGLPAGAPRGADVLLEGLPADVPGLLGRLVSCSHSQKHFSNYSSIVSVGT